MTVIHIRKVFTLLMLLFFVQTGFSQSEKITGIVESQTDGSPIAGVSVEIKGTQFGTTTDVNGKFTVQAGKNQILRFSSLGYSPFETKVTGDNQNLVIHLQRSAVALDELVITALDISKEKRSLGYSVQAVKSEDINEAREPNLVNSLTGKIAGVNITNSQGDMGSARIVIRGETSISGNNQPLFVIDGVPVDNTQFMGGSAGRRDPEASRDFSNAIADLNSEDIATVSVLKGPNAAALYGSRAAAGVILIQTKSGKNVKGLGVSVNTGVMLSHFLILPTYQNVFGQGANGQFSYVDGKGGGINDAVDESWGPKMDGQLIPQFFSDGKAVPFIPHPDNVKDFFQTGYILNNGVAVSGSGDKYHFRFSYNNMYQRGILPNTSQQTNSFTLNTGYKLSSKLSLDVMANYIKRNSPNLPGGSGLRETSTMLQFAWFGRQVDMNKLYQFYREGNPTNWNNLYYSNRYFIAYNNTVAQHRDRLIGSVDLKYQILKDLTATFRTGNDNYTDRRMMKVAFGTKGVPYGSYGEDTYIVNENNTEGRIELNKAIGNGFSLDLMGGGNIRVNSTRNNDQRAPQLAVAGVYTLDNSRVALVSNNYATKLKTLSLFSSAQIGYKSLAYLNLTARNDWSSTLPVSAQSYFYPSVSGSFILSQALNISSDKINFIKLRGGWSKVGSGTTAYQLINTYYFTTPFGNFPQLHSNAIDLNPDLKPEQTTSSEAGVEAGFFNNRLHIDVSLYNMNSYNQIIAVDVSPTTGFNQKLINGGRINNKGVEVELDVVPVQTHNFKWNAMINYSSNRSRVINLDKEGNLRSYVLGSDGTIQVLAAIDQPYGTLFGTAFERNDKGDILVDQNGLPIVDPNKKYLGKYTPKWIGSINNDFTYKHFDLSFLVDAHIGGSIYSGTNSTATYTGVLASTLPGRDAANGGLLYYYPGNDNSLQAIPLPSGSTSAPDGSTVHDDGMIYKGILSDGKQNNIIIPAQGYYKALTNVDEAFVYSASYVKLREVVIGYTLPASFAHAIHFQNASISLVGRNLWIISKHVPNIDPETAFNTGNAQGLEDLSLPTVRSYGININLKF